MTLKYSLNVILHVFPSNDLKVFPSEETQITILEHSLLMTLIGMQQKKFQLLTIKPVWMYKEFIIPEMQIKKERTSCVMRIRFPCIHHGLARADDSDIAE